MSLERCLKYAFLVALCLLTPRLEAQEPWLDQPFAADPREILRAAEDLKPKDGASAHVLFEGYTWVFEADGRRSLATRRVFQILQEDARDDWGTVNAIWKPWLGEKPRLRARVVRKDGTVLELDPATVAERPLGAGPDVFDDRRILSAPLPGLEVGAVVEVETVERSARPFPGGERASVSFGSSLPRRRVRLSVTVPETFPFAWRARGPAEVPVKESRAAGSVTRTWEAVEIAPNRDWEWSVPPDILQAPIVEFGTGQSWASIAETYRAIVEDRLKGVPFASWGGKATEPRDLLGFVQKEIRYTSIAFGDAAIVPQAPKDVLGRRFGDCKDQATLLTGLLRSRGYEAWVALLNAGSGRDVHEELPALAGFNHAIVYVGGRGGSPGTWVDPTSPFVRWGELPGADRDRWALICRPGEKALVKTPLPAAGADREVRKTEVRLAEDGKGSAVETVERYGSHEATARASYDGVDAPTLKKRMEQYVQGSLAKGKLVRSSTTAPRDLGIPFRTSVEAEKVGFAVTSATEASVKIGRSVLLDLAPAPAEEKRHFPLAVRPFESRIEYHVVPPRGYVLREMPATGARNVGPLRVSTESSQLPDGSASVRFAVAMTASRLTPDEASAFHKERREFEQLGVIAIAFESRVEKAIEQGNVRDALAERNADVRLDPKNADAHRRLSHTLLRIGLGGAGIREARTATTLGPVSAAAWHQLGLALQYDRFGRQHRGEWDLPGADRALEKAVELDAENVEYRIDRAILLEFDTKGTRYADRERLGRAIALYDEILKDRPELSLVGNNDVLALLYAGRAADAIRYLEKLGEDGRSPALIAAWALASGPSSALEQAHRRWGDPAVRRDAEEKAAIILLVLRRYELSADVMSDAAKGSPRAGELAARADFFRRVRPVDGLEPRSGDAASVARALFARIISGEPLERLSALFVREERGGDFLKDLRALVAGTQSQFEVSGLPVGVSRDLSYTAMDFRAEGDAASGWKARIEAGSPGNSAASFIARLVAEDGEPRIVGFDLEPYPYARLALRLARAGDLPGASRWLDRALEARLAGGHEADEDPLRGPLLPLFWSRGDAARVRLDAIVLACAAELAGQKLDDRTLADVRAALSANPDDRKLAMTLARALAAAGKHDEALEVARAWGRREPDAVVWSLAEAASLQATERYGDGARLMAARLAKSPQDVLVKRILAGFEGSVGRFHRASELGAEIVSTPDAIADDWNNLAWSRMLEGKNDAETLGHARRAVEATARSVPGSLNTLATVLVEQGQLKEGYDVVIEAMGKVASDEPVNADWFVLGRILEEYGFPQDASDAYRRVEGKTSDASGVAALARKRISELQSRPSPAK